MLRPKANKTQLYKLVSEYEKLPPMRQTTYAKADRWPDYWLEWSEWQGSTCLECEALFTAAAGRPKLAIEKRDGCGRRISRVVHTPDIKDLLERKMAEEYISAAERRRAERSAANGAV